MRQSFNQYYRELGAAMVCYIAALILSIHFASGMRSDTQWRTLVVLLPMLPCAGALWAILRQLRKLDELQVRVQLEALGFSFAGTAMLTFAYGFLEGVGFPRLSAFCVWPVMAVLWCLGLVLSSRRYH